MKQRSYNATLLLTSALVLLASLNTLQVKAQDRKLPAAPKLIIGIAVDQLRTDYIYAIQHKLGDNGLKRLINEGLVYEQVTFDLDNPDATAALAVLATGTYPFDNGIPSASVYNQQMLRKQSVFFDSKYIGYTTASTLSPKALVSTTLADELKTASSKASKVYAFAPDAESALISAGHTADCAFWIDDRTGKWASTTYYKDVPQYIARLNYDQPLFVDVNKAKWTPMISGGKVDIMPYHYETTAFSHNFVQYNRPNYQWFKTSPFVNDAIVQLAKLSLSYGKIGQGNSTDMLQLTFYAGTFMNDRPERYADELQDQYLRLDKSISELLSLVDTYVGLSRTFIYLTGTGATSDNTTEVEGTQLGEFNAARCTALLNSYLISLYGQGNWVDGFANYQIYLNHKTIESHKLKIADVQQSAAEFVTMFSGVSDVVSTQQILHEDFGKRITRMRNGYNKTFGGDILVKLQPGWSFKADDTTPAQSQQRHDIAPGPAILFAPGSIPAKKISTPVDATLIAPTVARCIRIRAPSGCSNAPLIDY